jgi:hypothetical protein
VKYGLGVFKRNTVIDDDFHGERCNQLFTQMNGCNIFFSCNLWFKVEKIKTNKGILDQPHEISSLELVNS